MNMKHFELAAKTALKSSSRFRLGAVLAKRNRAISCGWNNMRKTHTLMERHKGYGVSYTLGLHSEVHACIGVPMKDLVGAEMYIYRIRNDGSPGLAKPCPVCMRFMAGVGIRVAHFTLVNGYGSIQITE